jgi:hypothetical protein
MYIHAHMQIDRLLLHIKQVLAFVKTKWGRVQMAVVKRFDMLDSVYEESDVTDRTLSMELLELLGTGLPSPAFQQYIHRFLSAVTLLRSQIEMVKNIDRLVYVAQRHLHQSLEQLCFRFSEIRGLARWSEVYGVLGLDVATYGALVADASNLLSQNDHLQTLLMRTRQRYIVFMEWLTGTVARFSEDAEALKDIVKTDFSPAEVETIVECIMTDFACDHIAVFVSGTARGRQFSAKDARLELPEVPLVSDAKVCMYVCVYMCMYVCTRMVV